MRRSKSNPAKYARNYRSISQRRMTGIDNDDNDKHMDEELKRLKQVMADSEEHLRQGTTDGTSDSATTNVAAATKVDTDTQQDSRNRKRGRTNQESASPDKEPKYSLTLDKEKKDDNNSNDDGLSNLLSEEMQQEYGDNNDENPLIVVTKKKKQGRKKVIVQLTAQEIRQAKLLQKNTARKMKTLQDRAAQKQKRGELYNTLKETAISKEQMELLESSSTLGKRVSKREQLKKILQRERAGLVITPEERDLLYKDRGVVDNDGKDMDVETVPASGSGGVKDNTKSPKNKKRKETPAQKGVSDADQAKGRTKLVSDETETSSETTARKESSSNNGAQDSANAPVSAEAKPISLAAQMMASLSTLKTVSAVQAEKSAKERQEAEERKRLQEENEKQPVERYVPTNPTLVKTAANLGLKAKETESQKRVKQISRPEDVKALRYDLPVAGMEFEVMDAIRNNDVIIICGETGSGKSTQVPQFLYESGLSSSGTQSLIGVTQPRRVAAVSTAKRVCYEMGKGDGQTIQGSAKGKGNLVAYQTRYETAGLGKDTHIKFMTDGILLKEIQSDLLLRKYSAIILDEAHERNLNTDVLIGLLSVAIPLRKQAAAEADSEISPLKLVIMSATLRVEDFTGNKLLFPSTIPAVVRIPGRTHPVTIHHSKTTELDDYMEVAFRKICKVHRKLPQGGILVFLTGKQEIIRMVNRLRKALNPKRNGRMGSNSTPCSGAADVVPSRSDAALAENDGQVPRDLDDDEFDGDLFQSDASDDYEDSDGNDSDIDDGTAKDVLDPESDGMPSQALVLPLYSLLSAEEQAKIFAPVPGGQRLIVVATNIAETSITIPGISYVIDTGRHKCRNFNSATGVSSFDIMWISKAAADQRAGRAGRTGPGHCYRLYSSSMYSRQMDDFALPEVLTRPLEDVVLSMKAMNISNVAGFPFPTPPEKSQVDAAVKLLANIGCVELSSIDENGGDGEVTRLGAAVAKLPLGVRYGKILLVAAQAGVLDYAIAMVATLSESSPFLHNGQNDSTKEEEEEGSSSSDSDDDVNAPPAKKSTRRWAHRSGDVLAAMLAVGAHTFAGRGAGGVSERVACRKFCEENGLNSAVMERIQKMRIHLARLSQNRLSNAEGVAAKTGGILSSMSPPNKLQERLLIQAVASGLLDNIAMLAPLGSIAGEHPFSLRSAYLSCSLGTKEPLFMDRNSVVYSRDSRMLPQWVCFDSLIRKTLNDGSSVAVMKNITPIDPSWLGELAKGCRLLSLGDPLTTPVPTYDVDKDAIMCSVKTMFGNNGWEIPPIKAELFDALQGPGRKQSSLFMPDDSFRWFARLLFEGKVLPELRSLVEMLNDNPAVITRRTPVSKVALLVSALSSAGVDSAAALRKHWAEIDNKFLFKHLKSWIKADRVADAKRLWMDTVKENIKVWTTRS